MAIDLVTKFLPYTDERYTKDSKSSLLTNNDFDFVGANVVRVYKISVAPMNDYVRHPVDDFTKSRYGTPQGLDATTETFYMQNDRSFTFSIDKLDTDETAEQLEGAKCLNRQLREVVIPEIDKNTYSKMVAGAGTVADAVTITPENIYDLIIKGTEVLDDAEVPVEDRCLTVTAEVYRMMKKSSEIILNTDVGEDMRIKGVIGNLDGMTIIRETKKRLPDGFGFMISHKGATVAPQKLTDYKLHQNPPGISGTLVEGRVVYDAFVLDNKKAGIYYQPSKIISSEEATKTTKAVK